MHHLLSLLSLAAHAFHVEKDGDILRFHVGPQSSPLRCSVSINEIARQITSAAPEPVRPFIPLVFREVGEAVQRHRDAQAGKKRVA